MAPVAPTLCPAGAIQGGQATEGSSVEGVTAMDVETSHEQSGRMLSGNDHRNSTTPPGVAVDSATPSACNTTATPFPLLTASAATPVDVRLARQAEGGFGVKS